MDKFALFVFNIFVNSFLSFFTTVLLLEVVIFLFRVRKGRLAAFLRMIPILKLPLDIFFYDFSKWSYMQGINPMACEEGSRLLSLMIGYSERLPIITSKVQFTVPGNSTFTVADMISYFVNSNFLISVAFLLIICSFIYILRKIFIYKRFFISLQSLTKNQITKTKEVHNLKLNKFLKKRTFPVRIFSSASESPFVVGFISPAIYIPSSLEQKFTQKEYEAVLAHEIEHIRKKDTIIRLVLDFISAIFWWVPTKWLQKQVEEGQEISSDLQCIKYGVDPIDLASAIYKTARESSNYSKHVVASHLTKHVVKKRVDILLNIPKRRFRKLYILLSSLAVLVALLVIFLGRFWIF